MTRKLGLTPDDVVLVADPATTTPLHRDSFRRQVHSTRVAGLLQLSQVLRHEAADVAEASGFTEAMAVLRPLEAEALASAVEPPQFGAWLATARALIGRDAHRAHPEQHLSAHLSRLAPYVLTAARRAGRSARLSVCAGPTGTVPLVVGRDILQLPLEHAGRRLDVDMEADVYTLLADGSPISEVDLASRTVIGAGTLHTLPVIGGLVLDAASDERRHASRSSLQFASPEQVDDAWTGRVRAALDSLATHAAWLGEDVLGVSSVIAPMVAPSDNSVLDHTSPAMYGLVATTLPPSANALAEVLVHETQHSKLHVIMAMSELVAPSSAADLYSPWRADRRPVSAVLHGAYSFMAVAELWASIAERAGPRERAAAVAEAVRRHDQVAVAVQCLDESGRLTDLGRRFVDVIGRRRRSLEPLREQLGVEAAARISSVVADHREAWHRRHGDQVAPPGDDVEPTRYVIDQELVDRVPALGHAVGTCEWSANTRASAAIRCDPTTRLIGLQKAVNPDDLDRLADQLADVPLSKETAVLHGHVAYCQQRFDDALGYYARALAYAPEDLDRWVDAAFTLRHLGRSREATWITRHLEDLAEGRMRIVGDTVVGDPLTEALRSALTDVERESNVA